MTAIAASRPSAPHVQLPRRPCPSCGTLAPSVLAALPSGRKVIIGACAVCGRRDSQDVSDLSPQERARLPEATEASWPATEAIDAPGPGKTP